MKTDPIANDRPGSIVALVALLLPLLIALVAFAVDYGVIIVADQELQNAADAAASATLRALNSDQKSGDLAAFETITANEMLGDPIAFDIKRTVHYGTWDRSTSTFTEIERNGSPSNATDVSGSTIPKGATAVRIRLTRSRELGNALPLFFAPVIGTDFAEIEAEAIAAGSPPCSGFIGIDSVDLRNRGTTDSYNSDIGDYPNDWEVDYNDPNVNSFQNGDVCSEGPITLASGAEIHGDAAGSSVTISQGSGAQIFGSQGPRNSSGTYDPVDFDEANINDNETIPDPPKHSWPPQFLSDDGDLIVSNGRNIVLESGVYRVRDLKVAGGSRFEIRGNVKIYVERELRLDNGTKANPSSIPNDLQLLVGAGPVNIQGGNELHGVIYAPQASVTIGNNGNFFGSIIGKTLTVTGGAKLHFDESLADEESSGSAPILVQ